MTWGKKYHLVLEQHTQPTGDISFDILASLPRTKSPLVTCRPKELEPCFVTDKESRASPDYSHPEVPNLQAERRTEAPDMLWICRPSFVTAC